MRWAGGEPPECILLADVDGQQQIVGRCCARSRAAGVHSGMTIAHARALLGSMRVHLDGHRPRRDATSLRLLAQWAMWFSPIVAVDPPDGLFMDITGCTHLFDGVRGMVEHIGASVNRLGLACRVAAAPTFGCAWAVARFGRRERSVVPDGRVRDAMGMLPVRSLRVDEAIVEALEEVGVERVGHVLDLPRSQIPARFGDEVLRRLDQALGEAFEVIEPERLVEVPRIVRIFDGPTTHGESIDTAVRTALEALCDDLACSERGIRSLRIELSRSDCPPVHMRIMLARASRDVAHLWSLIRPRLERTHLGFGVEGVMLTASRTQRIRHEQAGLGASRGRQWGVAGDSLVTNAQAHRQIAELVDAMVNRLGAGQVVRVDAIESHVPEQAFRRVGVMEARERATNAAGGESHPPPDRPSVLFDRPEPARVMALTPDGPVHRLTWRGADRHVVSCLGPERIAPEWWRASPGAMTRDWFKVQVDHGLWLWLFHDVGAGRWFVHGVWA